MRTSTKTAVCAIGAVSLLLLTAPTALAHEGHPPAVTSAHWAPAVLRCVVLVASAAVCGVGLLRPVAGQPSRLTRGVTLVAGLLAAVVLLVSMAVTGAAPGLSMAQAVLTVLVPLLLAHELVAVTALVLTGLISYEACAGHAGTELAAGVLHVAAGSVWLGAVVLLATAGRDVCEPGATHGRSWLSRRLTPWALAAAALVAVTGISQAWADGLRPDAVTVGSTFGQVVTLKALLFLVVGATGIAMSRRQAWRLAPVEANGLTAALAAGALLAAIPAPPLPGVPSVALLRTVTLSGAPLPMTVVPQRPGWNLVHAAGPPGSTVAVGLDRAHLTRMAPRPGTTGGWALVHLPPGHSTLWVERGGAVDALRLNTADGQRDPRITGPDGPECASAALGALLANPAAAPGRCPADALSTADGVALRELVGFLARRHVRALDLVGDGSPRSAQASAAVRAAAVASGVAIGPGRDPNLPRIVVGGWPTAELVLQESARGAPQAVYLAPWLATAALLAHSTGAVVALGFDPREAPPHDYLAALRAAVPGESCTPAGYTAWLAARGMVSSAPTRLYASARISLLPAELDHHHSDTASWVPGGALIPVTAPLAP